MWSLKIIGFAIVLVAPNAFSQLTFSNDASCSTPNNVPGTCINLKLCPALFRLLTQKPLSQSSIKYLQASQCGFDGNEPKVCCEKVVTETTTTSTTSVDDTQPPDVTNHPNIALLDHERCGIINRDRILGGHVSGIQEFPWMALLAYRLKNGTTKFSCGGSVITKRYILTAAHCIKKISSKFQLIGVRVGEHNLTSERDCRGSGSEEICNDRYQDFYIEKIIVHPLFKQIDLHNDIAMIKVKKDIDFRPANAKPICMPIGTSAQIRSKKLIVTGWGVTENKFSNPVMLKVNLPIFPQDQCASAYARFTTIWYKQMCIGGEKGYDSCTGDSGGPLQGPAIYNGSSRYVQYGIVSFGARICGVKGVPGVYTRVDYYLNWILDNLSK